MRTRANSRKRAAPDHLFTDGSDSEQEGSDSEKDPTPGDHSTSHQSVEANVMREPKRKDSQPKKHKTSNKLSENFRLSVPNCSSQLSFVASHVNVNFGGIATIPKVVPNIIPVNDNIPAHSRPAAKPDQGKFELTLTDVSNLSGEHTYSPDHNIANFPWKVGARRSKDKRFLYVAVYCSPVSTSIIWSCEADIEIQLVSSKGIRFVRNLSQKFKHDSKRCCFFVEWSRLINIENGFVNNDEATIEVKVAIKKTVGIRQFSEFDFVSEAPSSKSDVVLVVGGQRMRVCRHYLSIYSHVFHAMFFSDFIGRDKKEIVLEDIEPDEFLELLHVIYPSHKPVTMDNVEFLLELGDRFEIQFVVDECERFLMKTKVRTSKKLLYAEKYRLANLQDECILTIKGLAEGKALAKHAEFKELTDETKSAILKHLLDV